jgi:hypothetical protein
MGNGFRSRIPAMEGRVLVTGGSGFIGRRLVAALTSAGAEVTVADLKPFPGPAGGEGPDARGLGYEPTYDLETGMATAWPDFRPEPVLATKGAR